MDSDTSFMYVAAALVVLFMMAVTALFYIADYLWGSIWYAILILLAIIGGIYYLSMNHIIKSGVWYESDN